MDNLQRADAYFAVCVDITNIRAISHMRVDLSENGNLIIGENGNGKTSLLLAIEFALHGYKNITGTNSHSTISKDSVLLRNGESGAVTVHFSNAIALKRVQSDSSNSTTVTLKSWRYTGNLDEKGNKEIKYSPLIHNDTVVDTATKTKEFMRDVLGLGAINVLKFSTENKEAKQKIIMQTIGAEDVYQKYIDDLDKIADKVKPLNSKLFEINKTYDSLTKEIGDAGEMSEIKVDELLQKSADLNKQIKEINEAKNEVKSIQSKIDNNVAAIKEKEDKLEALKDQWKEAQKKMILEADTLKKEKHALEESNTEQTESLKKYAPEAEKATDEIEAEIESISKNISSANETNGKVAVHNQRIKDAASKLKEKDDTTVEIIKCQKEKKDTVETFMTTLKEKATAVDGLSVKYDINELGNVVDIEYLYNGRNLESLCTSEIMSFGYTLIKARNPKLRLQLIDKANCYDDNSLRKLFVAAQAHGIQPIAEYPSIEDKKIEGAATIKIVNGSISDL